MSSLIIERVVGAALDLLMLAALVLVTRRGTKQMAQSAGARCPKCTYEIATLPQRTCPECGLELDGPSAAALRHAARMAIRFVLVIGVVGLALPSWWFGRELLQVNRLVKAGPLAFVPGYSLIDGTFDGWDLTILVGAVALYVAGVAALFWRSGQRVPRAAMPVASS